MLIGKNIGLRAIERDDLCQLLTWRNEPDLRKYFREYRELSMENQNSWFEKALTDQSTLMFTIVRLDHYDILGAGGLCYIDWKNRSAELSIYIGHNLLYIDDEFAPDAARVLLRYSFEELGLHRIWVEVFDSDTKKQSMLKELGFELEGRHRQTYWTGQKWRDSLFFSLLSLT